MKMKTKNIDTIKINTDIIKTKIVEINMKKINITNIGIEENHVLVPVQEAVPGKNHIIKEMLDIKEKKQIIIKIIHLIQVLI